jgi:hypothetical protein
VDALKEFNDPAERAIALMTEYNITTDSSFQLINMYKVIKSIQK